MLSSITPLGQRSKGMSWGRTVIGFWIGAIAAGTAVFSLLGVIGELFALDRVAPWVSLLVVGLAAVLDWAGVKPPGPRRQVNEDWLGRYRDWVIGFGFGAQLGVGFVTIIPSFGTWALYLVATASGLPLAAALGAAFGLGRSLLLITTRVIWSPSALATVMQRFTGAERKARWVALAGYALVLIVVGVDVV
ncbi:MAG TPA: hypothetical protein VJ948_10250 [Acidimicrobiia bacterium]|nr:hypothetical protein [Acidimicrobiia bacterium]